jgi:hypothetical protein
MTPQEIADGTDKLRRNMLAVLEPLRSATPEDPEQVLAGLQIAVGGLAAGIDVLALMVGHLARRADE